MTQTLTPTLKFTITGSKVNATDQETAAVNLGKTLQQAFTSGTEANKVDLLYSDSHQLAAGASTTYDLGSLVDAAFGAAQAFVKIRAMVIYSKLTTNKQLSVGGGANPFASWLGDGSDVVKINPGGWLVLVDPATGYAVTPDTGDVLTITNASGGTSDFDIWFFGTSA